MIDRAELQRRVLARVSKDAASGCWNWTGATTRGGYGTYRTMGMATTAHRVAYMAWVGDVPPGMELDHLCKNTRCVNPEHLEAVTHAENVARASKAMQTHCEAGHEFTEANTYTKKNGCRSCRTCNAARQRKLREKNQDRYRGYDRNRKRRAA